MIQSELFYSVFIHLKVQYVVLFVRSDFCGNPELNVKRTVLCCDTLHVCNTFQAFLSRWFHSRLQSQRAQTASLTGSHPRPTTVKHLMGQQCPAKKTLLDITSQRERPADEIHLITKLRHVLERASQLWCHHSDVQQVMASQLKGSQRNKVQLWEIIAMEVLQYPNGHRIRG